MKPVHILVFAALLTTVWLGRYDLVSASAGGEAQVSPVYRLDRWTGEVRLIHGDVSLDVRLER
jgi:hypothetical protein